MDPPLDPKPLTRHHGIQTVVHLDSVGSTSDYALQFLRQWADHELPALVVADRQTQGRGRGNHRWWSADGSLSFTVVIAPSPARTCSPTALSLVVGLAVARAVQQFVDPARVRVKWPNDVFVDCRKVCGVLIEQPSGRPARWVIGVGVNVNNSLSDAPEDVRGRATSLSEVTGDTLSRQEVLSAILTQLQWHLDRWAEEQDILVEHWRALCLLTGKWVELDVYGSQVSGYCEGIDEEGGLWLRTSAGPQRFVGGIVTHFD